jgi:hypothetical protein
MGGGDHADCIGSIGQNEPVNWIPRDADPATYHTLVDGIPQYMVSSLRAWFVEEFSFVPTGSIGRRYNIDRMEKYDLASRRVPLVEDLRAYGPATLFEGLSAPDGLRIIDWTVFDNSTAYRGDQRNAKLESILSAGSSKWKVGTRDGGAGLEGRVPHGVQDAADAAMATSGDAGRLLSEAWHSTYGINPQPDLGYRKSIEAVEAVVIPRVMPGDGTAHLGKAIGQMRADGDWKLPFVKEHPQNPSQDVVLGMMQALWSGHSDRHPGTSNFVPSTQEAAEAAVSVAVTLVNLFADGGIARRL